MGPSDLMQKVADVLESLCSASVGRAVLGHPAEGVTSGHIPASRCPHRPHELLDLGIEILILRLGLEGERRHVVQIPADGSGGHTVVPAQIAGVLRHVEDPVLAPGRRGCLGASGVSGVHVLHARARPLQRGGQRNIPIVCG